MSQRGWMSQEEAGKNQSLFREINERVEVMERRCENVTAMAHWVCECADLNCTEMVEMALDEYERVRSHASRFLIRPGHAFEAVEQVVVTTDCYWLVEKIERAAGLAAELDPRSS